MSEPIKAEEFFEKVESVVDLEEEKDKEDKEEKEDKSFWEKVKEFWPILVILIPTSFLVLKRFKSKGEKHT